VPRREIKGDDLLYRFFNEVLPSHPQLFEKIPRLLLLSMAIWFPKNLYQEMPVLLPWVLRDPECRGKKRKGQAPIPDQWGAPNAAGYLRDDNSLVKGLPKSLKIASEQNGFVHGRHLGNEFVASHIWRENSSGILASRLPMLNTFVPNLVWLPSQVAKLSDREGGPIQTALKEISWSLYRNVPLSEEARKIAEVSWALLPEPSNHQHVVDDEINWFITTPRFLKTRKSKLAQVVEALERIAVGAEPPSALMPSKYRINLPTVGAQQRERLKADLSLHIAGIDERHLVIEIDHKGSGGGR
jgi:hypothetical protein